MPASTSSAATEARTTEMFVVGEPPTNDRERHKHIRYRARGRKRREKHERDLAERGGESRRHGDSLLVLPYRRDLLRASLPSARYRWWRVFGTRIGRLLHAVAAPVRKLRLRPRKPRPHPRNGVRRHHVLRALPCGVPLRDRIVPPSALLVARIRPMASCDSLRGLQRGHHAHDDPMRPGIARPRHQPGLYLRLLRRHRLHLA